MHENCCLKKSTWIGLKNEFDNNFCQFKENWTWFIVYLFKFHLIAIAGADQIGGSCVTITGLLLEMCKGRYKHWMFNLCATFSSKMCGKSLCLEWNVHWMFKEKKWFRVSLSFCKKSEKYVFFSIFFFFRSFYPDHLTLTRFQIYCIRLFRTKRQVLLQYLKFYFSLFSTFLIIYFF